MKLEDILNEWPDETFLRADSLDEAVIGVDNGSFNLVYSIPKCIEITMKDSGMDREEATEFLEFNTFSAYMGAKTPIWIHD